MARDAHSGLRPRVRARLRRKAMVSPRLPARAARHVAWRVRRAATVTLDSLRRGDRTVITTPSAGLRFGNWLYLWLNAHQRTAAGEPTVVLEAPGMDPWLRAFPALRGLTVSPDLLRFHDRREWSEEPWNQRFGVEFTREALDAFIDDCLAPYVDADDSGMLVVNVRRGDYYSNPGLRERYGFDQLGYLRDALTHVGHVERALIVSDDQDWSRDNVLEIVAVHAETVEFAERNQVSNFKAVAAASRIVGMNSTFTYWGAYISGVLHSSPLVVMPRFHARMTEGTDAHQLDPRWIAVDGYF
jgi:hypothetical protein